MFFCLLENLTPASPQQIGMAHSQMRFLPAAWGGKKRSPITTILHDSQSYHTWARCRCMLTFVCVCVCLCACLHTGFISLLVSLPSSMFAPKLESHVAFQVRAAFLFLFFLNKCIDPWNLPLLSLYCESEITVITEMHATLSMTVVMWCSLVLVWRWSFDFLWLNKLRCSWVLLIIQELPCFPITHSLQKSQ